MRATIIATALMLAATPAFAGHGHGGHGGQGHSSAASSHGEAGRQAARAEHKAERAAAKEARQEARAERKADKAAKKQSITFATEGPWSAQYAAPAGTDPETYLRGFGTFTMQPNGRFSGAINSTLQPGEQYQTSTEDTGPVNGKVNRRTGAIKGKTPWGKLTGTYTPDDPYFSRSEMSGDILGKHGMDIGDWVADGPDVGNWE